MAQPAPRSTSAPKAPPDEIQENLQTYLFLLTYPVGGGQTRYFQRSILSTTKPRDMITDTLDRLCGRASETTYAKKKASGPCQWRLCKPEEGPELDIGFPIDPPVVAVNSSLTLAKRSRATGTIYTKDREYCPVAGNLLRPFVTSCPVESESA